MTSDTEVLITGFKKYSRLYIDRASGLEAIEYIAKPLKADEFTETVVRFIDKLGKS